MKIRALMLVTSVLSAAAAAADYKADWQPEEFYNEVQTCRTAIVLPAINGFTDKGVAAKKSTEQIRMDTISMLPLFEHAASAACYCAVNEVAKTVDYKTYFGTGDFTARTRAIYAYFEQPVCADKMKAAVAEMQTKELTETLRLK